MRDANIGPSSLVAASPRICQNSTGSTRFLANLKTSLGGTYHAFDLAKYGTRYLGAFVYRFNRRFHLETLPLRLLVAVATIGPRSGCWLRQAEESF
jgi:hypothetical protein